MSPNIGNPSNGLMFGSSPSSSAMIRCYERSAGPRGSVAPMTIAVLTGASSPLGKRVARLLADDATTVVLLDDSVHPASRRSRQPRSVPGAADVVVDLGTSDYDRRAERRESASEFVTSALAAADRFSADQIVFVSSALVYGAAPNNPKPLTEDAVLAPRCRVRLRPTVGVRRRTRRRVASGPPGPSDDRSAAGVVARRG